MSLLPSCTYKSFYVPSRHHFLQVNMAESNPISSESEKETESHIDLSNVGHTMSDESSSDTNSGQTEKGKKRKIRKLRKLIVEKRTLSSDDDSDKENKKTKIDEANIPDFESDGNADMSPLYQNQEGHPNFPFENSDNDNPSQQNGNNASLYFVLRN